MPNSKPKESYLVHAKISSDKVPNQPTTKCSLTNFLYKKYFYFIQQKNFINVTKQYLKVPRENVEVDNKEIKDCSYRSSTVLDACVILLPITCFQSILEN